MFERKTVWWIECKTGCSCCAGDNFDLGFWDNPDEPQAWIDQWRQGIDNPLGSQYAKYGVYWLNKSEAEILPDGRWIVEDTVFSAEEVEDFPGAVIYW